MKCHIPSTPLHQLKEKIKFVHADERGYFFESFNSDDKFDKIHQINTSYSKENMFRGFHFQHYPYGQDKLVTVLNGTIIDIIVDICPSSPTYKQYVAFGLTEGYSIHIPKGYAHGFYTAGGALIQYMVDSPRVIEMERTLDYSIVISNINTMIMSEKDRKGMSFEAIEKEMESL